MQKVAYACTYKFPSLAFLFFLSPSLLLRLDTKKFDPRIKDGQMLDEDAVTVLVPELSIPCNPRNIKKTPSSSSLVFVTSPCRLQVPFL